MPNPPVITLARTFNCGDNPA